MSERTAISMSQGNRVWHLQRRLGRALVFIAVVELQKNGSPHLHLLIGSYLPKQWISDSWQALGGGWATRIEYADIHRVAAYLSKYLTEDSVLDLPSGTRRFSTSRGLALFERSKRDGKWILTQPPIEFWREFSSQVTVEEYETEADGARRLVRFVASGVPACLLIRFSTPGATRIWLEVGRRLKGTTS